VGVRVSDGVTLIDDVMLLVSDDDFDDVMDSDTEPLHDADAVLVGEYVGEYVGEFEGVDVAD
jgi:hypothetical protein